MIFIINLVIFKLKVLAYTRIGLNYNGDKPTIKISHSKLLSLRVGESLLHNQGKSQKSQIISF